MSTISLSMIVKNEEKYLRDCLNSVKEIVDEIVIVDTGSTDKTKELAREFNASIYDFKWINDFSAARNFALTKSTCDWILYLDADERLDQNSISELKRITQVNKKAAYYCLVKSLDGDGSRDNSMKYPRLFARHADLKFSGVVHEQIIPSLQENKFEILDASISIIHIGYNVSREEKKQKASRNLALLLEENKLNNSPYCEYQLGLTYQTLDQTEEALKYFKLASQNRKLENYFRAQCYTSMAFIAHQNHNVEDSEKNILQSLKIDDKQSYANLLASKISLRKSNLPAAEEYCKRAYKLNKETMSNKIKQAQTVYLNPEEVICFGITLAMQNSNATNYQFYLNELRLFYTSLDGPNSDRISTLQKVLSNSVLNNKEEEIFLNMINNYNLGFLIAVLKNNPNDNQVIVIVEKLLMKFSKDVELKKTYANLLDKTGRVGEAAIILEKLISENEADPSVFFYLILFYIKQNKPEKINSLIFFLEKNYSHIPDIMAHIQVLKTKLNIPPAH